MKKRQLQLLFVLITIWSMTGTTQAVQKYDVIQLERIFGASSPFPYGINNQGEIVGRDDLSISNAYLINQQLEYVNLAPNSGSTYSSAFTINNNGIIGGQYGEYATIFDSTGNGNNTQICTTLPSAIHGLNNNMAVGAALVDGENVGISFNLSGLNDYTILGGLPQCQHADAWKINNNNQIIGNGFNGNYPQEAGESFAVLFDSSGSGFNLHLGGLYGTYGAAWDINDSGIVVGESHILAENPLMRATIFDPGQSDAVDLGTTIDEVAYYYSGAMAINNNNQIVGAIGDETGARFATFFDETGHGNNIDLNTLIDPESGWRLLTAYDINDNGWIIGHGEFEGRIQSYLLKSVPEPATLSLLMVGVIFAYRRQSS